MLLPYLTDSLGHRRAVGRAHRLRAQGVGRGAQPGRRADQRPHGRPRRPAAAVAAAGRRDARGRVRADLRRARPRLAGGSRRRGCWSSSCWPRRRTRSSRCPTSSMPAEITSSYDERTRLMTVAGGDPGVHDHARRRDGADHPRRRRRPGRLPRDGGGDGVPDRRRCPERVRGTRRGADRRGQPGAGSLREQLRIVAAARDFRLLLTTFVLQALATGCMLAGVDYLASDVLGRQGAATILFVCFVGPALVLTPLWARYGRAGRQEAGVRRRVAGAGRRCVHSPCWPSGPPTCGPVAATGLVGVGYAGCQVFPMAMLPDAAAIDAARTGENRVGVYTGVWTAGRDPRARARPGRLRGRARPRWLRLRDGRRRRPSPTPR